MTKYNFKGELFQQLLAQAKKDTDAGELMELEDMGKSLGYTPRDVAAAIATRFKNLIPTKEAGSLFRYGVLMGWYAALSKGQAVKPPKKPWWQRLRFNVEDNQ